MPTHGPEPDHELFRYLDDPSLAAVRERLRSVDVGAGEVLVEQNEMSTGLFVIEDGLADVLSVGSEREMLLGRLGAGEIFGEVSLVDSSPRTARVRAATPMKLLVLTREDFLAMADADPVLFSRLSLAILESLCRKFRRSVAAAH